MRSDEYGVRSDEYGVRSETLRRFELFYRNVKEAADKRGDEDGKFFVWLNSNIVENLHDVLQLLKKQDRRKETEPEIYIEKLMDELIDEVDEHPTLKAAVVLRYAKTELRREMEPKKPCRIHRNQIYEDGRVEVWAEYVCPRCERTVAEKFSPHYPRCMFCGQTLDWEDCFSGQMGRFPIIPEEPGQKKGE